MKIFDEQNFVLNNLTDFPPENLQKWNYVDFQFQNFSQIHEENDKTKGPHTFVLLENLE